MPRWATFQVREKVQRPPRPHNDLPSTLPPPVCLLLGQHSAPVLLDTSQKPRVVTTPLSSCCLWGGGSFFLPTFMLYGTPLLSDYPGFSPTLLLELPSSLHPRTTNHPALWPGWPLNSALMVQLGMPWSYLYSLLLKCARADRASLFCVCLEEGTHTE